MAKANLLFWYQPSQLLKVSTECLSDLFAFFFDQVLINYKINIFIATMDPILGGDQKQSEKRVNG